MYNCSWKKSNFIFSPLTFETSQNSLFFSQFITKTGFTSFVYKTKAQEYLFEKTIYSTGNQMDDVDRLFECFKCGVSPPQSALKERKVSKGESKVSPRHGESLKLLRASPGSAYQQQTNATNVEPRLDKCNSVKANNGSSGKQITPVIFYGSPHGVPPKRPLSLLRLLREIRVDLSELNECSSRRNVWATFPRQDEAMKLAQELTHVRVFSYQDHFNGKRRFLVSTYREFWRRYKKMNPEFRHHYEVIQEGLPCHLYFDLEFNRRDNIDKNGDEMVDLLVTIIQEALLEKYSIQLNHEWIIELDSSTEEKFSRHLVIRIPRTAFKDNSYVGAFVAEICSRIHIAKEKDETYKKLFISKDSVSAESSSLLFVDTAVYSRNRCFRLALSSKAGKNSVLIPTARFKCKDMCEEDMFMASLICNMDDDFEKLLICKTDLDCAKTLYFNMEENHGTTEHLSTSPEFTLNPCPRDISSTCYMEKSPFPSVDMFVESIASTGNVPGKIRSWYWFSRYCLMVYSMSRNRYCERIGREHKSNHVMYVVDLRGASYYQKCHDPDCRGYRSPLRPMPMDVIPGPEMGNLAQEIFGTEQENSLDCNDYSITDSCKKDQWWTEAIRFAENVENMQQTLSTVFKQEKDSGDIEDDEWWIEVERVASFVEVELSSS